VIELSEARQRRYPTLGGALGKEARRASRTTLFEQSTTVNVYVGQILQNYWIKQQVSCVFVSKYFTGKILATMCSITTCCFCSKRSEFIDWERTLL
jgi:hypothetical protein